jgi:hypothetical protein
VLRGRRVTPQAQLLKRASDQSRIAAPHAEYFIDAQARCPGESLRCIIAIVDLND